MPDIYYGEPARGKDVDTVLRPADLDLLLAVSIDGSPAADKILAMTGAEIRALRGRLVAESLRMHELEAKIKATHRAVAHTLRAVTAPEPEAGE